MSSDTTCLVERLEAGATKSMDVGTHLRKYQDLCDEAAKALRERDTIIAGYDAMVNDAHKITGELHSRVAELEAGLKRIISRTEQSSIYEIVSSLLSKEP